MMKQKFIAASFTLALVLAASPALAQDVSVNVNSVASTTPVRVRTEVNAEARVRASSTIERNVERRASSTQARVAMQLSVAKRKVSHTTRILTATVERLEKIIERIESRMEKVRAEGGVTLASEAEVVVAKQHLAEARTEITALASIDLSSDSVSENFHRIKEAAAEAKLHLREAHRSLVSAITNLKGMSSARANVNATSTASTTATTTSQ